MSQFQNGVDYTEEQFPRNWSNDERVRYINEVLADPNYKSVELLLRGGKIVVRTWLVDHLAG